MPIHLRRITVDHRSSIENRHNVVVDFIDDTCADLEPELRCRQWISILERRCSYTPATEAVLPSIHYARSVVSAPRFANIIGHYLKKICNPGEKFFEKSNQNSPLGPHRKASPLGFATRRCHCFRTTLLRLKGQRQKQRPERRIDPSRGPPRCFTLSPGRESK